MTLTKRKVGLAAIVLLLLALVIAGLWSWIAGLVTLRIVNETAGPVSEVALIHRGQRIPLASRIDAGASLSRPVPWKALKPADLSYRIGDTTYVIGDVGIGGIPTPSRLDLVFPPEGGSRWEPYYSPLGRVNARFRVVLRRRFGVPY